MGPQSRSHPPDPALGAPIGPIFSKNTKKTGDFDYKPGIFLFRYISGSRGRIDKVETGLLSVPPLDLKPLKNGGIRGYAAYPVIWAPKSLHTTLLVRSLSRSAKCLVGFCLRVVRFYRSGTQQGGCCSLSARAEKSAKLPRPMRRHRR